MVDCERAVRSEERGARSESEEVWYPNFKNPITCFTLLNV